VWVAVIDQQILPHCRRWNDSTALCRTWPLFQLLNVGLLGREISPSQGSDLHIEYTQTQIHALSGIRTHDPSVPVCEDSSCLTQCGHCDRQKNIYELKLLLIIVVNQETNISPHRMLWITAADEKQRSTIYNTVSHCCRSKNKYLKNFNCCWSLWSIKKQILAYIVRCESLRLVKKQIPKNFNCCGSLWSIKKQILADTERCESLRSIKK
jgi:hypothetical protein